MCNNPCKHSGNTITVCFKKSRKEYAVGLVVKQIHRGKKKPPHFSQLFHFTSTSVYSRTNLSGFGNDLSFCWSRPFYNVKHIQKSATVCGALLHVKVTTPGCIWHAAEVCLLQNVGGWGHHGTESLSKITQSMASDVLLIANSEHCITWMQHA